MLTSMRRDGTVVDFHSTTIANRRPQTRQFIIPHRGRLDNFYYRALKLFTLRFLTYLLYILETLHVLCLDSVIDQTSRIDAPKAIRESKMTEKIFFPTLLGVDNYLPRHWAIAFYHRSPLQRKVSKSLPPNSNKLSMQRNPIALHRKREKLQLLRLFLKNPPWPHRVL